MFFLELEMTEPIARLAAEGFSNRRIGEQLYISHRTVGYHLGRCSPSSTSTTGRSCTLYSAKPQLLPPPARSTVRKPKGANGGGPRPRPGVIEALGS
jgi:hypothetical protein